MALLMKIDLSFQQLIFQRTNTGNSQAYVLMVESTGMGKWNVTIRGKSILAVCLHHEPLARSQGMGWPAASMVLSGDGKFWYSMLACAYAAIVLITLNYRKIVLNYLTLLSKCQPLECLIYLTLTVCLRCARHNAKHFIWINFVASSQ